MVFIEERGNVFEVPSEYYLAQCISSDAQMAQGIATQFEKKFRMRNKIRLASPNVGDAILIGNVFNLITKKVYYGKPTYRALTLALLEMKEQCINNKVMYLAMPKIGCGLDRLSWPKVRETIQDIFSDTEISILIRTGDK